MTLDYRPSVRLRVAFSVWGFVVIRPLTKTIFLFVMLFAVFSPQALAMSGEAKVTIKVVDEFGTPLEGVKTTVSFEKNASWATSVENMGSLSNSDGFFVASGNCNGHISFGAEKDGYYKSHSSYDFTEKKLMQWLPWGPELELVMRKIEKPVAMYARNIGMAGLVIPEKDVDVGLDLVELDWLPPHGHGKQADMAFNLSSTIVSKDEYQAVLKISFPGQYNGVQIHSGDTFHGSIFRLPRYAPEKGYVESISYHMSSSQTDGRVDDTDRGNNYIFRVRSETKDGKFSKGMYGKILGQIKFSPSGMIDFQYYLNPDYSTNLEFDVRKNLFRDLRSYEKVGVR